MVNVWKDGYIWQDLNFMLLKHTICDFYVSCFYCKIVFKLKIYKDFNLITKKQINQLELKCVKYFSWHFSEENITDI